MSSNEWTEIKSGMAEVRRLEERVRAAEEDREALGFARARVEELKADGTLLTAVTEKAKAGHDTLAADIRKLEASAATRDAELGVGSRAVPSLKRRVAVGEDRGSTTEAWARQTFVRRCLTFESVSGASLDRWLQVCTRCVARRFRIGPRAVVYY